MNAIRSRNSSANSSSYQSRVDPLILGKDARIIQIANRIGGTEKVAGYLDFLQKLGNGKFETSSGKKLNSCEILNRISPLRLKEENLK